MKKDDIAHVRVAEAEAVFQKLLELSCRSAAGEDSQQLDEQWLELDERIDEFKARQALLKFRATRLFGTAEKKPVIPAIPAHVAKRLVPLFH